MEGLLATLRRILGGGAAPPSRPAPRSRGRPAEAPAPVSDPGDPFAPFARALGIAPPPPGPEAQDEVAGAAEVLEHFRRNRPGPASAPSLSLRILNLVAAPDGDIGELARLVSADPALAAGVLAVANSAAYRGVREIETVREAIARLGFEEVARVAGAVSARSLFNPKLKAELAAYGPRFAELFHRSLAVAGCAAWVAMQRRGGRSDRAYLGGMLHDVGKPIALRSVAALHLEGKPGLGADDPALPRLLDLVHLEIGGEVHQEWNLPQYLTVIAVRHHDAEIPGLDEFADLHAVRLASALQDLREGPSFAARAAAEVLESAGKLGLSPQAVRSVFAELRDQAQRAAVAFALDGRR